MTAPIEMTGLHFVDAAALADAVRSGQPVVVAFVATWNRRCQDFAAAYRSFAEHGVPGLPVWCVDVDEHPALVRAHDVFSVPTVLLLRAGRELHREIGTDLAPVRARRLAELGTDTA